jgi:DNA-binding HxlR family transcriptional regulator
MEFRGRTYQCSMELTLELIGGKWKSLILWHVAEQTLRFNALRREIPGVTQKMLTQQLRELEADGLLIRVVYPEVPPKVEYSLTPAAKALLPILKDLCAWGSSFAEDEAAKARGGRRKKAPALA